MQDLQDFAHCVLTFSVGNSSSLEYTLQYDTTHVNTIQYMSIQNYTQTTTQYELTMIAQATKYYQPRRPTALE